MLDFGALPPEINSGRMYSGPGPGSLLAAAGAWNGLAVELRSAAAAYASVISALTGGSWLGPASASMAAAVTPYMAWMNSAAGQAEEAATQIKAAAAAYESAFAATLPPPMIAANRAQLMALVATNFFGQNSPAIAATEAQYGEMWAQDAAAMYGYAAASSAASTLTPFTPPPRTTNAVGAANQAAAVAKAAGTPVGTGAQMAASTATSAVPQALQHLSSAASSTSWLDSLLTLLGFTPGSSTPPDWLVGPNGAVATIFGASSGIWNALTYDVSQGGLGTASSLVAVGYGLMPAAPAASPALGGALPPQGALSGGLGALGSLAGGGPVSANLGRAGAIGRLSVPPSWAATPSAMNSDGGAALSGNKIGTTEWGGPAGLLRGIPMTKAASRASGGFIHRYGFRHTVMPRPPAAG